MMMPPPAANGERRLIRLYRGLNPAAQGTLLRFAEFLATEGVEAEAARSTRVAPVVIERPDEESVVAAIKRLSLSYHMLDRHLMLDETSTLMAGHVLRGRPARDVIDELEALFARHYGDYLDINQSP